MSREFKVVRTLGNVIEMHCGKELDFLYSMHMNDGTIIRNLDYNPDNYENHKTVKVPVKELKVGGV